MIRHADSQLCYSDTVKKEWFLLFEDGTLLTNSDIERDEITITENLCSKQDITLGCCEASTFEVHIFNTGRQFKGKKVTVTLALNGHTNNPIPIGVYKIEEETLSDDQRIRELKGHDLLYEINNRNVAKWFNEQEFPMTIKELRDAFFSFIGVPQEETNLVNDGVKINIEVANSSQTSKKLDEMSEKVNQDRIRAIYGVNTSRYVYIDPSAYEGYQKEKHLIFTQVNVKGYVETTDKTVKPSKLYYERKTTYSEVTDANPTDSPSFLGWYERKEANVYEKSDDPGIEEGKTYYRAVYSYLRVTPRTGDNPKKLGWWQKVQENPNPSEEGWYEISQGYYTPTKDTSIYDYFLFTFTSPDQNPQHLGLWLKNPDTYTQVTPDAGDNPYAEHWYIVDPADHSQYKPTTDIEVDPNQTYYSKTDNGYTRTEDHTQDPNKKYYKREITSKPYYQKDEVEYHSPDLLGWYVRANQEVSYQNTDFSYFKATPQEGDNPSTKGWYQVKQDATYAKSQDLTSDVLKDYFEEVPHWDQVTPQPGDNPAYLKWYVYDGENYNPTDDETVDPSKTYFKKLCTYNAVPTSIMDRPQAMGWFEYANRSFELTTDQTVVQNKHYYIKSAAYDTNQGEFVPATDTEIIVDRDYYIKQAVKPEQPVFELVTQETDTSINPSEMGWWECEEQEYFRTTDIIMIEGRTYYRIIAPENDNTAYMRVQTQKFDKENPKEEGWYEIIDQCYKKTQDTAIDFTKAYYIYIWEYNDYAKRNTIVDEIKGSEIIQAICEINGRFGHMSRDGVFKYVALKPIDFSDQGLWPRPDLYPDPNLYPVAAPFDEEIERSYYEKVESEDYYIDKINRLVIQKEDNDVGYAYPKDSGNDNYFLTEDVSINQNKDYFECLNPEAEYPKYSRIDTSLYPGANPHEEGWYEYTIYNTYTVTGNFIWYGFTDNQYTLDIVGQNLLTYGVAQISEYRPFKMTASGNPCIEVGDSIKIHTRTGDIYSYVISRTLKGSQRITDEFETKGNKRRSAKESIYEAIVELKGKSNVLERTIDHTMSKIIDISNGLSSMIEQTSEKITLAVTNEVKGLNDKISEKYESMREYTDSQIRDTVSHEVYDSQMGVVTRWMSEFTMTPQSIMAQVENTFPKKGEGVGFRWNLDATSFSLSSRGGYIAHGPYNEDDHTVNPKQSNWLQWSDEDREYKLSKDEYAKKGETYFEKYEGGNYKEVLRCDSTGLRVDGTIIAQELIARNQVITNHLTVLDDDIETINETKAEKRVVNALADRIDALEVGELTADNINTKVSLNASTIKTGKILPQVVDPTSIEAAMKTNLEILATPSNPYLGKIQIGNGAFGRIWLIKNTEGGVGSYHKILTKSMTIDGQSYEVLYLEPASTTPKSGP